MLLLRFREYSLLARRSACFSIQLRGELKLNSSISILNVLKALIDRGILFALIRTGRDIHPKLDDQGDIHQKLSFSSIFDGGEDPAPIRQGRETQQIDFLTCNLHIAVLLHINKPSFPFNFPAKLYFQQNMVQTTQLFYLERLRHLFLAN